MPVSGNFTSVTLGPDNDGVERLKVNGETQGDVDRVEAIFVAIAPADVARTLLGAEEPQEVPAEELPVVSVALPPGQSDWTAIFPQQEDPPFAVRDELLLTGVMLEKGSSDPVSWQQVRQVQADKDPAAVG